MFYFYFTFLVLFFLLISPSLLKKRLALGKGRREGLVGLFFLFLMGLGKYLMLFFYCISSSFVPFLTFCFSGGFFSSSFDSADMT